jgi:uncharacterized protein (TIGR00297 family)
MTTTDLFVYVCLIAGMLISIKTKKLNISAALCGGLLGLIIYSGSGFTGLCLLVAFFITGTIATKWKAAEKINFKDTLDRKEQRNAGQVFANAGISALLALLIYFFPQSAALFKLMLAASFSAAMADTLSSELGMVYGKRFYHILSFKKDMKGKNGVISIEGILAGISGSVLIAWLYILQEGWNPGFWIIIIAGTVGNLTDSLLGATFERHGKLSNNQVNFLNASTGAVSAGLLTIMF